jgi:hypothetical protein
MQSRTVFFSILITKKRFIEVVLKPEKLEHFMQVIGKDLPIEGDIYTPYRKAIISTQDNYILSAVERRGYQGFRIHIASAELSG